MKISKYEKEYGVKMANGKVFNYVRAPIICRDSQTGRDLHRNNTGKWFLHTPGMTGRPSITPLSIEEARQIVQRDGTAEQYLDYFFGKKERAVTALLSDYDLVNLERMAERAELSVSEFVRRLIRAEYRRQQKRDAEQQRVRRIRLHKMDKPLTAEDEPL